MSLKNFRKDENGKYIATSAFKLPRSLKYILSTVTDKNQRAHLKSLFAQATMQSFEVGEKKKKNATGKVEVAV
jgi:hypothetical protein